MLGGRASTLAAFEAGPFSLEGDLGGLTEKGLDSVRAELAALDAEAAEELRRVVHAHYRPFIAASQARPAAVRSTSKPWQDCALFCEYSRTGVTARLVLGALKEGMELARRHL